MHARRDTGLMIIELRKYNSAEELLIGPESTGSPGQVYSRNTDRRVSVTRKALLFESAILDPNEPDWADDFSLFTDELASNFGTYDPISEAEAKLEGLHMHDSHQATKYFIQFQQLGSHVQWGEAALHRQAYNGLAKRIKDDMVHHNKPNTLAGLRKLVQAIDTRYWERRNEVSRETRASGSSGNKSEPKSDSNKSDNKNTHSKSKQKDNNSGSTQGKGSSSDPKKSTPDLSSKLGKDGKLTPQE